MKQLLILVLLISCGIVTQAQTNYERDSLAKDGEWQTRVRVATIHAAKQILGAVGEPQYLTHYCQFIVSLPFGDGGWLDAMSYAIATQPEVNFGSTDDNIQFYVNANINAYAAAYYKVPIEPRPQP